ncbi:MAG: hypothetical protein M3552_07610 [Planctomycetota bacterium]|nr:hypothetical protein [Planctomycetota bacterium]
MTCSTKFQLDKSDLMKIAKGAALAAAGAVVTFLATEVVPHLDESTATGAVIAAVASTALNALRTWLTDTRRPAM